MSGPAEWEQRRSRFNHDWLKNGYLPALRKWSRILCDEVEDAGFEWTFLADVLPSWESKQPELQALLHDCENMMTPRSQFETPPLSEMQDSTKRWLTHVMHVLWLTRYSIREGVSVAISEMGEVQKDYLALRSAFTDRSHSASPLAAGKACQAEFERFRAACLRLSKVMEHFPYGVVSV